METDNLFYRKYVRAKYKAVILNALKKRFQITSRGIIRCVLEELEGKRRMERGC